VPWPALAFIGTTCCSSTESIDSRARFGGLAQILEDLDQASVVFRSATEPFDTGTPAGRGRKAAYRYYTCFSRNRYGRHGCQADPAAS
jgi:hypothetical protein